MSEFVQGQRWVVDSEPELGLGIIMSVQTRTVEVFFPQVETERLYAKNQAPLTRIAYSVDDTVKLKDGRSARVVQVHSNKGFLIYDIGDDQLVPETELAGDIQLNQPYMRLLTGQLDKSKWFYFRRQLDDALARTWNSRLNGLLGIRANLIPHQLYVAWAACEREQVRVLLADEVGLGKTLEAGMILTRLLKLERIERALVVVPDALQVQWLVELIRRFSLRPELYAGGDHDFSIGQIHLIPQSVLVAQANVLFASEFDCVVVDEAHHIQPHMPSFTVLQQLAHLCPHIVLLTATPEQLGFASHFARLQLLDPAKYTDMARFSEEEKSFALINKLISQLPASRSQLVKQFDLDNELEDENLIAQVLDCHGLGRVMFRNSRAQVKGFPARIAVSYELTEETWYCRFEWLANFLNKHKTEKILVICHEQPHVLEAESYLWQKHGLDAALFHEGMNLVERDRAAAYFANMEDGAQVLLCSEIGGEGRNFQFSHHLVCLDLPVHPDVLEQRIGRLDRIGQTQDVCIHIPVAKNSLGALQFEWFNQVLNCIAEQNPAAGVVHDEYWPSLHLTNDNSAIFAEAKIKVQQLTQAIHEGRDALLEMNSCREPRASELVKGIMEFEANTPFELVEMASSLFNFHFEETQNGAYSLIPADNMLIGSLPGIPLEGVEVTFSRALANTREDLMFITWDSPFISGLWEILHHSELGCASVALLPSKQLPPGKCLLEACFDIVMQSVHGKDCLPFLSAFSVRSLVLDISDKNLSALLPEDNLQQSLKSVDKKLARKIIQSKKDEIPSWYKRAEVFAEVNKQQIIDHACAEVNNFYLREIHRLQDLAKRGANINESELTALKHRQAGILTALIEQSHLQLSAIRLIVTTEH
ncbi:MAG: polymerase-associated protein RapA [Pseudomonadota bacterium]